MISGELLIIRNSTFTDSNAMVIGGIIDVKLVVRVNTLVCSFNESTSRVKGGAIYSQDTKYIMVSGVIFIRNAAGSMGGGALFIMGSRQVKCIKAYFVANIANASGGAVIVIDVNNILLHSCAFYKNAAKVQGGAISCENTKLFVVSACIFIKHKVLVLAVFLS